jgi:hypothetical protein
MLRTVLFTLITTLASAPVTAAADISVQNLMADRSFYVSDAGQGGHEIVFIDADVSDHDVLIDNLRNDIEIILLGSEQDAVSQITATLQNKNNVSALHIITHGSDGEILFTSGNLSAVNLQNYRSVLSAWSSSLTDKADILLYGCNVAEGEKGRSFLHSLSEITGADVAASENITGDNQLGGDWSLEHRSGDIETMIALTGRGIAQYRNILPPDPPPSISSAHIGGDGSSLVMVYDEPLDETSVPAVGAYTVTSTALGTVTVNSVSINEFNTVTLGLASTIAMTDSVTVDYDNTFGATHVQDLTTPTANLAVSLTSQSVNVGTLYLGSSEWAPIAPSGGSQFDYFVDQQTGQPDGDIVGDGGSNPGFQVNFDDNNTPSTTDGTLSFRFRIAESGSNYYMVGIDADLDGAIDVYIRSDTTNTPEVEIVANGGGLNISPSTSDLGAVLDTSFPPAINTLAATDIDGAVVGIVSDLDAGGNPDFYVNVSVPFSNLVTALATVGVTGFTDASPRRYAVATSVNGTTFNQDIAGLPKQYDVDATYVSSGAFSDPVNSDGTIAPTPTGTPVINDLAGDALAYVMNDAASALDQSTAATVTDSDDTSLDDAGLLDGSLHVEITTGAVVTEDLLGLDTALVTLSAGYTVGSIVTVGVTDIGTITDIGTGVSVNDPEISFTVTFDQLAGSATLANVNTLIQAVTYVNTNIATATEGARTVSFLLSDGALNTKVSTSVSVYQSGLAVFTINAIADASVNENSVYTGVVPTTSGDTPIGSLTYTLGGTDSALFTIDSVTGVVSMIARDFESPADSGGNNVYDLTITATDANGNNDTEAMMLPRLWR